MLLFKLFPGTSTFMEALAANGTTNIQTSVTGVTASKRRFIDDRRDQPFDKRLRFSVRQTESAYRYRDIVVRKQDGFTHILLSTKSSENNSLNPEVWTILIFLGGKGAGGILSPCLIYACYSGTNTQNKIQAVACKMLHIELTLSVIQLSLRTMLSEHVDVSYKTCGDLRSATWNKLWTELRFFFSELAAYAICCPNYRNAEWVL